MRRTLIRTVLPPLFCAVPALVAVVITFALPEAARQFYFEHMTNLDRVILALGGSLFAVQTYFAWRGLQWTGDGFDERTDRWLGHLSQAAEWFPLLGLIGTVSGILLTFSKVPLPPDQIIREYAPAITATGGGLFMALVNILPVWVVMVGRDIILSLGGQAETSGPAGTAKP